MVLGFATQNKVDVIYFPLYSIGPVPHPLFGLRGLAEVVVTSRPWCLKEPECVYYLPKFIRMRFITSPLLKEKPPPPSPNKNFPNPPRIWRLMVPPSLKLRETYLATGWPPHTTSQGYRLGGETLP